jgi:hypothetical protein
MGKPVVLPVASSMRVRVSAYSSPPPDTGVTVCAAAHRLSGDQNTTCRYLPTG